MQQDYYEPFEEPQENNIIYSALTPQETEIALSYLKKRFANYPIEKVVSTLDHYIHKSNTHTPHNFIKRDSIRQNTSGRVNNRQAFPSEPSQREETIANHRPRFQKEERSKRSDDNLKVIAGQFCQNGYDYHKAHQLLPEITPTTYRNGVVCIVNTIIIDLLKLVRSQCKIQLEVTPFQRSLIRDQVLYAHKWMGRISVSALATLFKLIQKKFKKIRVILNDDQLIELYSVITKRLKDNNVNLSQIQNKPLMFGKQIEKEVNPLSFQIKRGSKNEKLQNLKEYEMNIAFLFIKHKNIQQTLKNMSLFLENDQHCNLIQVENCLKNMIKKSINQLLKNIGRTKTIRQMLGYKMDENLNQKIMQRGKCQLKIQLLKYYIAKKPSKENCQAVIKLLNEFMKMQGQLQQKELKRMQFFFQDEEIGLNGMNEWKQQGKLNEDDIYQGNINDNDEFNESSSMKWLIQ